VQRTALRAAANAERERYSNQTSPEDYEDELRASALFGSADVREREIPTLVEERLVEGLGEGVREAVAVVQACWMAALAETAEGRGDGRDPVWPRVARRDLDL
jgi:hypothetical protein